MISDTIDIEDFANTVKSTFVTYFSDLAYAELLTAAPWAAAPVLSYLIKWCITKLVSFLAGKGGLAAFIINTNIFTADQASDYMKAVGALQSAPDGLSDTEWSKLEEDANHAFRNLVRFGA